jgi:putative nucleotidyltransferase with HDIG domain
MDAKAVRNCIEHAISFPTIPGIARKGIELVSNPDTSLLEMGAFIAHDSALASRLLKMVNSVVFGFPRRISSVNQALLLLGLNAVQGIVWNLTVFDLMKHTMAGLWEHSAGCAIASRLIAREKGFEDPQDFAVYGLLHDVGKTILLVRWPKIYAKALNEAKLEDTSIRAMELAHFGVDHATAGAWLAEQWKLPKSLIEVVKYHHAPGRAKEAKMETAIAHVADILVRGRGFGFAGDTDVPPVDSDAWKLLELSERDLRFILSELESLMEQAEELTL